MDTIAMVFNYVAGSVGELGQQGFGSVSDLFTQGVQTINDAFGLFGGSL